MACVCAYIIPDDPDMDPRDLARIGHPSLHYVCKFVYHQMGDATNAYNQMVTCYRGNLFFLVADPLCVWCITFRLNVRSGGSPSVSMVSTNLIISLTKLNFYSLYYVSFFPSPFSGGPPPPPLCLSLRYHI